MECVREVREAVQRGGELLPVVHTRRVQGGAEGGGRGGGLSARHAVLREALDGGGNVRGAHKGRLREAWALVVLRGGEEVLLLPGVLPAAVQGAQGVGRKDEGGEPE
ncbi:MAG: hypothetical protein LBK73_08100 [Treponema sp.]|nr:hypothetical protein [Treponema sp.]